MEEECTARTKGEHNGWKEQLVIHRLGRLPPSKLGVVVPTGFEPVSESDYDFALFYCTVRRLYPTYSQVGLKHRALIVWRF